MGQIPPTTVEEAQETNPAQQYTSIAEAAFAQNDWRYKTVNRPFEVYDPRTYGIVVQSSRFISKQIFGNDGNIIQENFTEEKTFAIRRVLAYYNKLVSELNIETLMSVTVLDNVEVAAPVSGPAPVGAIGSAAGTEGGGAASTLAISGNQNLAFGTKYYVLIDAASFDAIPSLGNYILTPMTKRTSIGALAEEYREYFRVTDRADRGHRARIAEILRTNGVDVLSARNVDVAEWIYQVNYGVVDPPGKDAKFNAGSEIYLPRTEPDFTKVIIGGQEIELTIGDISKNIDKLISMMETYRDEIRGSSFVYRTLNIDKQIGLLKEFYPSLISHFRSNDYRINDFFPDMVRIGIDENYFLIYVGLTVDSNTAYLNKALPGLAVESPFNDPRTMNFIANLTEISLLNRDFLTWEDFVSRYVFPEAIKESREVIDQETDLLQSPMSILEQLASRFDKFPVKSDRVLEEENDILTTPKLMAAMVQQQSNTFRDAGDAVFQNLGDISAKIANPGDAALSAVTTVYTEVLNKVDYRALAAGALECLMEQVPFDCGDIIVIVANLDASATAGAGNLGTETVGIKGLAGVNTVFKSRMRQENKAFADEAFAVADSKDFTRYQDKYGYQFYEPLAEVNAEKSKGEIYLAALEHVLTVHGVDYASIFQEVCGILSNPAKLIPDIFSIPTLFFPDNLPTVDIDGGFIASIEKAMLDAVIAIIVNMVNGLISTLLNNCIEAEELVDNANASTNNTDLAAAIASNVGDVNFATVLADLVNSFPGAPPPPFAATAVTGSSGTIDDETIDIDFQLTAAGTATSKIQALQDFFAALKNTFSATVNSMQIISLLKGDAPNNVVDIVVGILNGNSGPFPYGTVGAEESSLAADINYGDPRANVREMFALISQYIEIQPIIEDLNVIAGKVGCTDLNDFISQRVPLWCGNVDPENIPSLTDNVLIDNSRTIEGLWCIVLGCPELIPEVYDPQCTDEEQPPGTRGAVSKDPYSFSHMLAHVVKNIFDPVYMAYDSSVLTIPEPYYRDVKHIREVDRTIAADGTISIKFFNFSKLQEEEVELPLGEAGGALKAAGINFDGTPKVTVMNPEFNRLLGTGYTPDRGDPNGFYGPYTTVLSADEYRKSFIFTPDVLPPVKVDENVAELAPFSRYILSTIDDSLQFFSGEVASTGDPTLTFFLSEPINNDDLNQFEQTIMRIDLLKDNKYRLQVGKMSLTKNIPPQEPAPGFSSAIVPVPSFTLTTDSGIIEDAIYDTEYSGEHTIPEKAKEVLEYIADRVEPVTGETIQVKLLAEFMRNIVANGQRSFAQQPANSVAAKQQAIDSFSKNVMLPDIVKQMSFGIGKACADSPMLRFTNNNNAPYMALVDWAPLPSEEEAECGYDPHILAIDTMIKRVIEDYEANINCADLENEISRDGQGREGLSTLEAASMAGLVMTTLRAYALEQLFRTIFPISAYPCNDILTPIQIRFIVDKVKEKLSEKSRSYYNAFLEQLEKVYAGRMKDFSAFGTIPDVVAAGKELGIEWVYANCAKIEYEASTIREEPFVTLPSGEIVLTSKITATAIQEQLSNLPLPDNLPAGTGGSASGLFEPANAPPVPRPDPDPQWETCTIRGELRGTTIQGYRAFGSNDTCIPGPIPADTAPAAGKGRTAIPTTDDTPVLVIEASLDPELEASLHVHSCEITPADHRSGTPAINGYRVDDGPCIYNTYDDAAAAYSASKSSAPGFAGAGDLGAAAQAAPTVDEDFIDTTNADIFEIVDATSVGTINDGPPPTVEEGTQVASAADLFVGPAGASESPDSCEDVNSPISIPTTPLEEILDCRIGFLIEEQLYSLLEKFQDLVTQDGESSFSQRFLEEGVPLLDIYRPGIDTDEARSRLFGSSASNANSLLQEQVTREFGEYIKKYNEWHTANGNFAFAAQAAAIILLGIPVLGLFLGPFFTGLSAQLALGVVHIPVPKIIPAGEVSDGEGAGISADEFYTSSELGTTYIYTNVDIKAIFTGWAKSVTDFFTFAEDAAPVNIEIKWKQSTDPAAPHYAAKLASHNQGDSSKDDPRFDYAGDAGSGKGDLRSAPRDPTRGDVFPNPSVPIVWPLAYPAIENNTSTFVRNLLPGSHADANFVPFPKRQDIIDIDLKSTSITPQKENRELLLLSDGTQDSPPQGQVILERYVKTTRPPSFGAFATQDNFIGERFKEPPAPPGTTKINLNGEIPSVTQVLSPREVVNTSNRNCIERDDSSLLEKVGKASNVTIGGEINIATEQVWGIDEFKEFLDNPNNSQTFQSFTGVSFGLRMVYVAPPPPLVDADIPIGAAPESMPSLLGAAAIRAGHQKIPDGNTPSLSPLFEYDPNVISGERSYFEYEVFETWERDGKLMFDDDDEHGRGSAGIPDVADSLAETGQAPVWKERYLQLFPLVSVESPPVDFSAIGFQSDFQEIYRENYLEDLTREMKNSSIYQYLFKYSVPGDTMLTFVSIYANMTNELSDEFFDSTKLELKNLFEIISNGGDYTFETMEEKKRGGNRGEFARAMANYGTEGNARNPGLFDLAVKTPKQIFKGLAEFMDPVIKPASTIVKAGHAGKLLPQTMKHLNPDMTPGGVNDKNFFVTNVILPKGTVPAPVGDFAGEYPTVIRRSSADMPLQAAAGAPEFLDDNEMVTFRLRDRKTKGSETGNHFFDIYLQRVFFRFYNPAKYDAQAVYDSYTDSSDIANFPDARDENTGEILKPREVAHQNFILAMMKRDMRRMATTLFGTYRDDLEVVRKGIIEELKSLDPPIIITDADFLDFSPGTFKRLRENEDICNARDIIIAILKGERPVDPANFETPEGYNLATGQLFVINPETQKVETISVANGGGETIDWIIWGDVGGSITIPSPPKPEPVFPGYPLPLPVTPIAMASLPSDMVPYSPSPPHTPIGWAYHAIVAADNIQNISLDLKAVQREEEGMENKKKLHEKLCIDMERISAEEKKRRGLE